ncbi:hypothetical protein Cgig2_018530 [Carnegiea gigantea]|uniref:FAR1 domain-containing protein n=1 Tax=Carnegiea gigantea TaxID=171969 RepID=A0A9Q1GKG4_9CARY|nr:hypothetical protein Cgig2_018530 [Carnegiea gigantea]
MALKMRLLKLGHVRLIRMQILWVKHQFVVSIPSFRLYHDETQVIQWKLLKQRWGNKHLENVEVQCKLSKNDYLYVRKSNLEDCEKLYKSFTHYVGFSVRKSSCKKSEGVYKYYVCSKQGFKRTRTNNALKALKEVDGDTSESKISESESFIRSSNPEQIDILPPKYCHTKGSGKRIKGEKEIAMEQPKKKKKDFAKLVDNEAIMISYYLFQDKQDNYHGRGFEDYLDL